MAKESQSQARTDCPLKEIREQLGLSPEELAGVITYKSGQKISGATFRRREEEGANGWKRLSLTGLQWIVLCELAGVPRDHLTEFIVDPEKFLGKRDEGSKVLLNVEN
ncbi:hypothetical protein [Microcoleus sp. D2_18a_D3]